MNQYQSVAADTPHTRNGVIKLHGPNGFAGMRVAGRLSAEILDSLVPLIVPGVTTEEIDDHVREMTLRAGALPATLGYRGYTHSCCTSVNHVVCHGIPGPKKLQAGDIVNVDVTSIVDGWHGDTNRTYLVGDVPIKARRLVEVTYEAMMIGIEQAKPGNNLGDIGHAIQSFAERHRYGVVRDFCGHGIGRLFHDAPEVVHAARRGSGPELKPGMFFTIEPMINIGRADCKVLDDGWTAVTRDRSLSAQFEHTIGITETGCEIFTASPAGPRSAVPLMRGVGVLAVLAFVTAASAQAQGVIIASRGPDTGAFPPGTKIKPGQRISLRAGSFISALGEAGTYVFKGPGSFAFGAPFKRISFDSLYVKALIDPNRKVRRATRAAAVRGGIVMNERDWRDIDIATAGPVCLGATATPRLWREDTSIPLTIEVTNGVDTEPVPVEFAKGSFGVIWPQRLGTKPAATITLAQPGRAPVQINTVTISDRDAAPTAIASALIASGCTAQAEILVSQLEAIAPRQ